MKIFIGADHNGFDMKTYLVDALRAAGHELSDEGNTAPQPDDDYPEFAAHVVQAMQASGDPNARGILLCGSGQGVCIAANRFNGIRGCVIWNTNEAHAARNDDDCNVLCLPARSIDNKTALSIAQTWLHTPFAAAPRYKRRLKAVDELRP